MLQNFPQKTHIVLPLSFRLSHEGQRPVIPSDVDNILKLRMLLLLLWRGMTSGGRLMYYPPFEMKNKCPCNFLYAIWPTGPFFYGQRASGTSIIKMPLNQAVLCRKVDEKLMGMMLGIKVSSSPFYMPSSHLCPGLYCFQSCQTYKVIR